MRGREAEARTTWDGLGAMATSCAHVRAFVETRRDEIEAMMRASRGGGESESDSESESESESEDAWTHACATCATTCSTAREMRDHAHEVFYDRAREALTCSRCARGTGGGVRCETRSRDAAGTSPAGAERERKHGEYVFHGERGAGARGDDGGGGVFLRENHREATERNIACARSTITWRARSGRRTAAARSWRAICSTRGGATTDRSRDRRSRTRTSFFYTLSPSRHANLTGARLRPKKRRNIVGLATIPLWRRRTRATTKTRRRNANGRRRRRRHRSATACFIAVRRAVAL